MEAAPATEDVGISQVLVIGDPSPSAWWTGLALGPGLVVRAHASVPIPCIPGTFDVMVAVGEEHLGALQRLQAEDPDCVRILDPGSATTQRLMTLVNQGLADRLWSTGQDACGAAELLRDAVEESLLRRHNRALLDELAQRNGELLDFAANLERLIEERTTHLREAHLRLQAQQQTMLRLETHGMLTHLARGLAHELNNPLAAILGFAQRLRRQTTDEDTRRRLQVILDEVERCRLLVDQIRRLAAPLDEEITTVDPADALEQAVARQRQAGKLLPTISIHGSLLPVLAAPGALARILEEGLDNAVWAGARSVVLAAEADQGHIRVSLANDGATPSADDAFNATKPFFTTRANAGAQGLGLAVAAGLAREQDGYLELLPGRCGGAVLTLHLPAGQVAATRAAAAAATAAAAGIILVVDDQPLVAELLTDLVQDLGFTVRTAGDVRTAMSTIAAEPVAAILTDLHLPDGTGQDLATQAVGLRPELRGRVAVITGDPEGAGNHLPVLAKPFRAEQVGYLLHHLINPRT